MPIDARCPMPDARQSRQSQLLANLKMQPLPAPGIPEGPASLLPPVLGVSGRLDHVVTQSARGE